MKTKKNLTEIFLLLGVIISFVGMIFFLRMERGLLSTGGFALSLNIFTVLFWLLFKREILPYNRKGMGYTFLKGYKYLLFILGIYLLFLLMNLEYRWEVNPEDSLTHFSKFLHNAKVGTSYLLGFGGICFSILGVMLEVIQIRKEEK